MKSIMIKYQKTRRYNQEFISKNLMGPNAMMLLEEMTKYFNLKSGMRILDLGCGTGLTSIFLAKEYGVKVIAYDLWISETENYERFKSIGLDDHIEAIQGDANVMPFPNDYFDGVISVDSYQYYGSNDKFFTEKLQPILKNNAIVAIAVPGMSVELGDRIPEEMKPYWDEESFNTWHTIDWWQQEFSELLNSIIVKEMACFDEAWSDWLNTDNPHAITDRDMIKIDGGRYMNLIAIIGRVNKLYL